MASSLLGRLAAFGVGFGVGTGLQRWTKDTNAYYSCGDPNTPQFYRLGLERRVIISTVVRPKYRAQCSAIFKKSERGSCEDSRRSKLRSRWNSVLNFDRVVETSVGRRRSKAQTMRTCPVASQNTVDRPPRAGHGRYNNETQVDSCRTNSSWTRSPNRRPRSSHQRPRRASDLSRAQTYARRSRVSSEHFYRS